MSQWIGGNYRKAQTAEYNKEGPNAKMFRLTNFHCPKTFRRETFHSELKDSEYLPQRTKLQDDQSYNVERLVTRRKLDGISGYQRRLSAHTSSQKLSKVFSLPVQGRTLLFSSPPLRSSVSSLYLLKSDETPHTIVEKKRCEDIGLSGRSDYLGGLQGGTLSSCKPNRINTAQARFYHSPRKIKVTTYSDPNLVGHKMAHNTPQDATPRPICTEDSIYSKISIKDREDNSTRTRILSRFNSLCSAGAPRRKASHSCSSAGAETFQQQRKRRMFTGSTKLRKRMLMVDRRAELARIRLITAIRAKYFSLDRRIRLGLRSSHRFRGKDKRKMVYRRREASHKFERTVSGDKGSEKPSNTSAKSDRLGSRQHCDLLLHKKSGIKDFADVTETDRKSVQDPQGQRKQDCSITSSRAKECDRRRAVSKSNISNGMGTDGRNFSVTSRSADTRDRSGPDGNTYEQESDTVSESIPSSTSIGSRLLPVRSEQMENGLHFPTSENHFEGFEQAPTVQGTWSHYRASQSSAALVQCSGENVLQEDSAETPTTAGSSRSNSSNMYQKLLSLSRVDFLIEAYKVEHHVDVARRLAGAHRISTQRQYEHNWREWKKWLSNNNLPEISEATVLRYLEENFSSKSISPRTSLGIKSALKLPLEVGFGINLNVTEFSLLARAQFIARPPNKKIIPKWRLEPVLIKLGSSEFSAETCNLEKLTQKTIFLVALATGNRASEISAVDRKSIAWLEGEREAMLPVKPGFLFKNQRLNRAPPNIMIRSCPEDTEICPVETLKKYLARTEQIAKGNGLFVNPKTGANLNKSSLSLRICRLIEEVCPDSLPKMHDIRKQAVSLAWTRGVPPSEIVMTAFWTSTNIFIDRYLNPNVTTNVPCVALGSINPQ